MQLKKIVIASILKPVDDTRMYEKIGVSLGNTNKYEVNIIGFCTKKYLKAENIYFFPIFNFRRISFSRLIAPFQYLKIILKVKPELIIITTPELLIVTSFYKFINRCKLIYDVQENYHNNILYTSTYPAILKWILSKFVRGIENLYQQNIDHFFLAERCYQQELPFLKSKFVILENKFKGVVASNKHLEPSSIIKLIYTGTIAENYGIFQSIALAKAWHKKNVHVQLRIIGYCSHKPTLQKLYREISGCSFIQLMGGDTLVPHQQILQEIEHSHYGLVSYQPDNSITNRIPTKLYEYMALKLPIILQDHKPWVKFCSKYNAAVVINYNNFDIDKLITSLSLVSFYSKGNFKDLLWDSEEDILNNVVEKLLNFKNLELPK